jgi:ADP-ribose pyrophosphatase
MTVREDDVEYGDGRRSRFGVVARSPFVAVLAWVDRDRILMVRQYRYAVRQWLWELPQGGCHEGEDPLAAAARETLEETGWRLTAPVLLAGGLPEAGDWAAHTFSVVSATAVPTVDGPSRDPGEFTLDSQIVRFADVPAMVRDGRLVDPPSLCALQVWQAHNMRVTNA